jgi:dihydrolipoyl dehydrogenase
VSLLETQLLVIGGGPGGYPAALAAADRGMTVTLVDADPRPGGVCLHRGCIPSKALLHVARLITEAREVESFGLHFEPPRVDLEQLRAAVQQRVIGRLAGGIEALCKARGVTVLHARAVFEDSRTVRLAAGDGSARDGGSAARAGSRVPERVRFEHAILAVGSRPAMPRAFAIGDARVMDSTGALALPDIPGRLLVVGGGYIGLELGTVYAALGSRVVVVEMLDGLLPGADRDLVKPLEVRLRRQFEAIHLRTRVAGITAGEAGIEAALEGPEARGTERFDRVLVAVGRQPNSAGIGLEQTRVELDARGFVKVDSQRRTRDPHIFAIGDVTGDPGLAHKATAEAHVAVEALAGEPAEFNPRAIPAVVFTDPEIAWCGLTEREAAEQSLPVAVHRFPWAASGRATTLARNEGMTKLVVDPESQRVLGVGIVGVGAGELIAEGVLAVEMGAVARDLAESIHPHPTLSETLMESAELALGSAIHVAGPPAAPAIARAGGASADA